MASISEAAKGTSFWILTLGKPEEPFQNNCRKQSISRVNDPPKQWGSSTWPRDAVLLREIG